MQWTFPRALNMKLSDGEDSSELSEDNPILEAILQRLGERQSNNLKFLGVGGNAFAYWMSDKRKVFKITGDKTDAYTSLVVSHNPSKYIIKVHDVFAIDEKKYIWGIVTEKLTPLTAEAKKSLKRIISICEAQSLTRTNRLLEARIKYQENLLLSGEKAQVTQEDLDLLQHYINDLDARGIRWGADFYPDNVLMRRQTPVISDLGVSSSPRMSMPKLQVSET